MGQSVTVEFGSTAAFIIMSAAVVLMVGLTEAVLDTENALKRIADAAPEIPWGEADGSV